MQHDPSEQVTCWFSLLKQLKHSELFTGLFYSNEKLDKTE
jgi:hypothetical protein